MTELDDAAPLDAVTDLDGPTVPTAPVRRADAGPTDVPSARRRLDPAALLRWPASTPQWLRTPVALVAAVVVGAVVGGLLATGVGERRELQEDQSTVRLLSAISAPAFGSLSDGWLPVRVVVLNAGPEPVTVTGARLDGTDTVLALDGARTVQPGRSGSLNAVARLDCGGGAPGGLLLTVEASDGGTTEVSAPDLGRGIGILPAELSGYCAVPEEALPVFATEIADDGRLAITLRNDRDRVVQLTAEGPGGTSLTGEPALPLALERGETVVLRLAVEVERCTFAALRADAGGEIELAVDDARGGAPIDGITAAGWFAQQLARACPDGAAP